MPYADVHAHIDLLGDVEGALKRAAHAGVAAVITNGIGPGSNRKSLELAKIHPIVRAAVGLYPTESAKLSEAEVAEEMAFFRANRDMLAAIGEIGLDYQELEDRIRQRQLFLRQVELAMKIGKPVIVHSRKAEVDVVEALVSAGCRKVVMHCCMGSMKVVKRAVDAGFHFSIPALLSRSSHFRAVAGAVPSSLLLTETDAPFLSPVKGQPSEPAMVAGTVAAIAGIKGLTAADCGNIIFSNYQRLFR